MLKPATESTKLAFQDWEIGVIRRSSTVVITRIRRGEPKPVLVNITYLAMAVFVAWGRFGPESFG